MTPEEKNQHEKELESKRMHAYWQNMCAYSSDYYDIWKALRTKVDNALSTKKTAKQIVSILKKYKTPKKFSNRNDEFQMQKTKLIEKFTDFSTGIVKMIVMR